MRTQLRKDAGAHLLWFVLAFALCLRLGSALSRGTSDAAIDTLPDQREYLSLARNLLSGEGLSFIDPRFGDRVFAFRTPGYPFFLAACGGSVVIARVAQAILDTSTVLAVYLLGVRLRAGQASLMAAALVAVNPFLIYFSGLLLSETLYVTMLAWATLLLLRPRPAEWAHGANSHWPSQWWGGALLLTLSVLVRPSALLLPAVFGAGAAWLNTPEAGTYNQTGPRLRRAAGAAAGMFVLTGLTLLPWAWRNARADVLGQWVWTTSNGGVTAYDGFNPGATGASDQSFLRAMPELRGMGEVARSNYLERLATQYVRAHPGAVARLTVTKLLRMWSPVPLSDQFGSWFYRTVAVAYSLPFDLLAIAGLIRSRLSPATKVYLLLPAIYFSGIHAASIGSLRYRLPAEPPMALLAATFLASLRSERGVVG